MGTFSFMFFKQNVSSVTMDFIKSFKNLNNNDQSDSSNFKFETGEEISGITYNKAQYILSRRELAEYIPYTFCYGFHRTSVNDTSLDGNQPFRDPILNQIIKYPALKSRPKRTLMCSGEIYNYNELRNDEKFGETDLQSKSDVEIIMPMYIKYGLQETLKRINGDYAFVLTENLTSYNLKTVNIYIVRDILGCRPLYMIRSKNRDFYLFVSELKGIPQNILENTSFIIEEIPPGTYWSFNNSVINGNKDEFIQYTDWEKYKNVEMCTVKSTEPHLLLDVYKSIRDKLYSSVRYRFKQSDVPVGILLSGGFDSSIILSLVTKIITEGNNGDGNDTEQTGSVSANSGNPLTVFSLGDPDSKDVQSAQRCVDYLEEKYGIDIHHHVIGINCGEVIQRCIRDVIWTLESFDPSIIHGGIIYKFLFNYIKKHTNVKVLLTGEGLDELCGYADLFEESDAEFQSRSVNYLTNLGKYDLSKINKMANSYNLEVRHPFLDRDFVTYMLSIHPRLKRPKLYTFNAPPIEKYIVRKSFETTGIHEFLPDEILWRSIGDSTNSIGNKLSELREHCDCMYSDVEFSKELKTDNIQIAEQVKPRTKEELYYRKIFDSFYGTRLAKWMPTFYKK